MGNTIHKSVSISENNYPTPEIATLSETDVENIQRTWKIPAATVSIEGILYKVLKKFLEF